MNFEMYLRNITDRTIASRACPYHSRYVHAYTHWYNLRCYFGYSPEGVFVLFRNSSSIHETVVYMAPQAWLVSQSAASRGELKA